MDDKTAVTGPISDVEERKNWDTPSASKDFGTYTLGIVWDELTASVVANILRDCFQLARICYVNRIHLQIASDKSDLDKYIKFLGVKRVPNTELATYWRIYSVKKIVEVPESAEMTDVVKVDPGIGQPQRLRLDPNFSEDVVFPDVHRITDSVPLYRTPPSGPADQNQQEPW